MSTTVMGSWLSNGWARSFSLLLASPLALVLLIYPALMLDGGGHYNHSQLMSVMLGIAGGFVHGVGFDPRGRVWRILFGPVLAWFLLSVGYAVLIQAQMT
ncbi:cyd operon YbgE family protein [Pseudomonas sp. Marseille-QA0892]